NNPNLAYSLAGISRVLVKLGRAREAIAPGERAVGLFESQPGIAAEISQARFELASALWEGGGDRGRAARLARQARMAFQEVKAADEQHEVEAWLKQRGLSW